MVFNITPLKLFNNDSASERFRGVLNDRIGSSFLRKLNTSNIILTRYNGKLRYDVAVLENSLKTRVLSVNIGTQFQDATTINKNKMTFNLELEGNNCVFKDVEMFELTGIGIPVMIDNIVIAEYFPEVSHLNILFDFDTYSDIFGKQFSGNKHENTGIKHGVLVYKILEKLVAIKKLEDFKLKDWKNKERRESNLVMMKEKSTKLLKQKIEGLSQQISQRESKIQQYMKSIVTENRALFDERLQLEAMDKGEVEIVNKLIGELDAISENVYIDSVAYSENMFEFITKYLPIYNGSTIYEGDSYLVQINMDSAVVVISSATGKGFKGHWTQNDPHPHVSGSEGKPCLGSIGQSVADMVAKHELYVLTVLMVEYLKAVNTDDSAGSKITSSGRKKLTKDEHDALMAYETMPIIPLEEFVPSIKVEIKEPEKKSKKKREPIVETVPCPTPIVVEQPANQIVQEVSSICVVCGADVYGHGSYQPVVDKRNGAEVFTVACNRCVNGENGFVPGEYGIPAYVGTAATTIGLEQVQAAFDTVAGITLTFGAVDELFGDDEPVQEDEEAYDEEYEEDEE